METRICQWIDDLPTGDDACKCGEPVEAGELYCAEHSLRAYRNGPKKNTRLQTDE